MTRVLLGYEMYLFRKNSTRANELLISSHGMYLNKIDGKINVPAWTQLVFFTPHGKVLDDPGVGPLISGKIVPFEFKNGGDEVPNYRLSKFQGYHSGRAETYESIEKVLSNSKWAVDVLTIRNRIWRAGFGLTLNEVLSKLDETKNHYQFIYCSFCRSSPF